MEAGSSNSIKKIVFLLDAPFSMRDYDRFGIEILLQHGFRVELWDIITHLLPDVYQNSDEQKSNILRIFNSKISFIEQLKREEGILPIVLPGISQETLFIYETLSEFGIPYCSLWLGTIPYYLKIDIRTIAKRVSSLNLYNLKRWYLNKTIQSRGEINKPALIVVGGAKVLGTAVQQDAYIINAHALDFDLYLRQKDKYPTEPRLGIFIDQNLPDHVEYALINKKPTCTMNRYYSALNRFFSDLEAKYNVRIAVAAHPRVNMERVKIWFDGRDVYFGKTAEMITRAGFVLAHFSTAINLAVLNQKPIIFLTTSELEKATEGQGIRSFARTLGKIPICIDKKYHLDWQRELHINQEKYKKYMIDYIKTDDSPDELLWEIVAKDLIKLNRKGYWQYYGIKT